ncbi:MAG: S-methyl-5-thioribose-1-phosphate isomerase [Burkholderiales bacterium]|nr:S-methyl-5-thioribose-1-phosphate isomerase [Burkholderiales bacterium]
MSTSAVATLRWNEVALELIDQRVLPQRLDYVRCGSAAEVAAAIRDMVVRGAPAIGCAAAYGIALAALEAARRGEAVEGHLLPAFDLLAAARPTAVNLRWALERMHARWRALATAAAPSVAPELLAEAMRIQAEDLAANRELGRLGASLLPQSARVLTHCNAGALATTGHGTALGVIRSAVEQGKQIEVIADETRPFLQGARLTAWELQRDGIAVTLIADSAAGYLMSLGQIDAVIVGADRVAANGDVANKIGTYPLAVLAQRHAIPFYVACPVATIDATLADGAGIPIEERCAKEVLGFAQATWAPSGVAARNPAFDITPAELVCALITERGVARPPFGASIAALLSRSG